MNTIRWQDICPEDAGLHIATIEWRELVANPIHKHDFYECFLVLDGTGLNVTPWTEDTLQERQLYFLHPEHAHTVRSTRDLVFLNVAIERSVFKTVSALTAFPERFWKADLPIQCLSLSHYQAKAIQSLVNEVAGRPNKRNAAWFLLSLSRLLQSEQEQSQHIDLPEWMASGLNRAKDPEVLKAGIPGLTKTMGRSREHVTRCFQKQLGTTPTAWLNTQRIELARRLLTTTRFSVLEVALECGYESVSYFHKCFRENMGTSPLKYRKQLTKVVS